MIPKIKKASGMTNEGTEWWDLASKGQFRDRDSHPIPDQMYVKYGSKLNQATPTCNYHQKWFPLPFSSSSERSYWKLKVYIKWIKQETQEPAPGHCDMKNGN